MGRQAKQTYAELKAISPDGVKRLSYHGSRWLVKKITTDPYRGATKGNWVGLMSRDGKTFLWVQEEGDKDIVVRIIQ